MDFYTNLVSVMFDMKSVAGEIFSNLLKYHQQKTNYINMLNASTAKHLFETGEQVGVGGGMEDVQRIIPI